jgi:hypothetical protein
MPQCPQCARHLMRRHRTSLQKLIYSDVFRCPDCDTPVVRFRSFLGVHPHFLFSRYTHCIQCGTPSVYKTAKRDRIDSLTKNPFGRIQQLLGAPVIKCLACRLQYYDWRAPRPATGRDAPQSGQS